MEFDLSDYTCSLQYKTPKLEDPESLKHRRLSMYNIKAEDTFDIESYLNQKMRRIANQQTQELPEITTFTTKRTPPKKDQVTIYAKNTNKITTSLTPPIKILNRRGSMRRSIVPNSEMLETVTIAAKKYAEQLKNSKFSPKLESIIRKQSPVLYETHRLFESLDHNDHKKIFYQLYKTIKARKFVPLNTRDEQVENAKWNRLTYSRREQKIKQPTANQNHSDHDVFFNTVPDMTTDGIIHRIITSLSSSHPSDIKKVIQEIDKNSRMNRPKPIVSEIINICSQSQRSKHNLQYVEDFLKMQVAFQDTPDYVVSELANYMRTEIYQDNGHAIFRQGDLGNRFYFIIRGSVRLTINKPGTSVLDQNPPQNFLAIMKTGEKFGEFALLNDLPRNSSAFAAEKNTAVLTLEKDQFIRLLAVTYQVTLRNNIKLLSNFPLFKKLDNQGLRIIAEKLFTRTVPPNTIILEEGSLVESVFFIRSGKCAVFKKIFMNDKQTKIVLLGNLGPYTSFNEEAALSRTSTARTNALFTVVSIDTVELGSVASYGEWLNLNLNYKPSSFVSLKNEDLVKRFKISQHNKRFREYQKKYISQIKREANERNNRQSMFP